MTATTSDLDTPRGQGILRLVRRSARAAGSLVATIGSGWRGILDAGDIGPDVERSVSRHTGARI